MDGKILKNKDTNRVFSIFMFVLIVAQPFLDVLSYFLIQFNKTTYSTLLRMAMFVAVMLFAFIVSDKKKVYYVFAAIAGGYFVLHAANCYRIGYISLVEDAGNFFRTVQMPALCLAFVTFIKRIANPIKVISAAFLTNVFVIWGVIGLSYLVGRPEYTYGAYAKIGIMGWFGVHNAQSAIVLLLAPLALLYAYKKNVWAFLVACAGCFSLLFFTGTKLTFYSLVIVAIGFIALIVINFFTTEVSKKKYVIKNSAPIFALCAVLVLTFVFIDASPMRARENLQNSAYNDRQEALNDTISQIPAEDIKDPDDENGEATDEEKAEAKRKRLERYEKIYREFSGGYLNDMIDQFGIERVAEKYNYSTQSAVLLNNRQKKAIFAELAWEDSDFITRCFGYEYMTLITDEEIYDLENDFPAVFYYSGYVGFAVYMLFLAYFVFRIFKELFVDFKTLISIESGLLCGTLVLLLGAAQLSGNVLRRPNVSIYISLILACIFVLYSHKKEKNNELSEN